MSYKVVVTSDFKRAAKRLNKKYPSFKQDFSDFIKSLEENPLQGAELYPGIRKIRMRIKSKGKGSSGDARIITYNVLVNEEEGEIYLIMVYDKEDFSSVETKIIREMIHEMGFDGGDPVI